MHATTDILRSIAQKTSFLVARLASNSSMLEPWNDSKTNDCFQTTSPVCLDGLGATR